MAAPFRYGQFTPPPYYDNEVEEPYWNPWDELEVRDRFSRKIRCLGFSIKNSRCRWTTDDYTLRSRVPQIEHFLNWLSQKSPYDVTKDDLWYLMGLGVCGRHGSCRGSAKSKGFRDLLTRLAAARYLTNVSQVSQPDCEVTELLAKLHLRSAEVGNHDSRVTELEVQLYGRQGTRGPVSAMFVVPFCSYQTNGDSLRVVG